MRKLKRSGFTLIELLVVVIIIGLISVLVVPTAIHAIGQRGVTEAARLTQGAFVGARDAAIHANAPRGVRLVPDPALPGAVSQLLPLEPAPDYSTGFVTVDPALPPGWTGLPVPCLLLEQCPTDAAGMPLEPTSWSGNLRVGDQVRIGVTGPWFTIAGPQYTPVAEGFVNADPALVLDRGLGPVEYLFLVNGRDDDGDGFVDNGWDGVDNNHNGTVDELAEWEAETWPIPVPIVRSPYTVRRRLVPGSAAPTRLPGAAVIDLARSVLPSLPGTAATVLDLVVQPDGTVTPSLPYAVPSGIGITPPPPPPPPGQDYDDRTPMDKSILQFWVGARSDVGNPAATGDAFLLTIPRSGRLRTDAANPADPLTSQWQARQQ